MKHKASRRSMMIVITAIVVTVLAGCGGTSSLSSSSYTADSERKADPDGELRIAFVIPPALLNPHKLASDIGAYPYLSPLYDRLTQMVAGEDGAELAPMVATQWTFAEDGMSSTYTLRDDVTFADGEKLDAAAVKANFDHALNSTNSTVASYLSPVESVDVVDDLNVRFNTSRKAVDLPYVLSGAAASLISPSALDNPDLGVKPVGSGPYTAVNIKVGDSVKYERRAGYWDDSAQSAKTITITGMPDDNARLNALRSGQANMAYIPVTAYNQSSKMGPDFGFYSYPEANVYGMQLNTARPNVDNVKFRQALNFAVDREGISKSLTYDQCVPNAQPLAPGREGHLDDPADEYTYDPERARQLLTESGIVDPKISVIVPGLALQTRFASALQDLFGKVGVDMQIQQADAATSTIDYAEGSYDATVQSRTPLPASNMSLSRFFLSPRYFPGPVPAELRDAVVNSYDPNIDETTRIEAVTRASAVATEQALDVFVCAVPTQFAFSDSLLGIDNMGVSSFQGIFDARYLGIAADR